MPVKHIVFIHGFLENSRMWHPITAKLSAKAYRIHFPELPGHGIRQALQGNAHMTDYARDIRAQLNIRQGEKIIVVGHSMGGYAGIELARLVGPDINALCLFHSTARADSEEKKADRQRAIDAVEQNQQLYTRTMISGLFHEGKKARLKDAIEAQIADANAMHVNSITQAIAAMRDRNDNVEWLKERSFPLYYFLGDCDSRLPLPEMHKELEKLPGSVADINAQTGHMGHLECPKQAIEFIQRIVRADM